MKLVKRTISALFGLWLTAAPASADVDICATASCSGKTTTGTMTAGSAALTLAAAQDFVNGQGIRVEHAGIAAATGTPTGLGTSVFGTTGSTSYLYQVASIDGLGGLSAATGAGGPSNGNVQLTPNNYIQISFSAPGGTAPKGYAVWRSKAGGAFQFLKIVDNTTFWDYDINDAKPNWIPALPPIAAMPQALTTTISSGGGTTSLTLAATATSAVTAQPVLHDDTTPLAAVITTLNSAGGGYNLTCPGSARIRYNGAGIPSITVGDARIDGHPGCKFLPTGTFSGGGALTFAGPAPDATVYALQFDIREGGTEPTLTSTAGLSIDDYISFSQLAGGNINGGLDHYFTSRIRGIYGNVIALIDATPTNFVPFYSTVTVNGTFVTNDTITVNFPAQSPVSVTYTVTAADTSTTIVANNLAHAINMAYNGYPGVGNNISAFNNANKLHVYIPSRLVLTFTASKVSSGGSIVTVQNDATTAPVIVRWTPIERIGVYEISMDLQDFLGYGIFVSNAAEQTFKGIRLSNSHNAGCWVQVGNNYNLVMTDFQTKGCASASPNFSSYADVAVNRFTRAQMSDIRSEQSKSFGFQVQQGSWVQGSNIFQTGAEAGRGLKTQGVGGYEYSNVISNNVAFTNFAAAFNNHHGSVMGLITYGGERGFNGNGTCIWHDDAFDTFILYFGVHATNCYWDTWESFQSNRAISMTGGFFENFNSIYNPGLTRFRNLNGFDLVGGQDGSYQPNHSPFAPNPTGGPSILQDSNQ